MSLIAVARHLAEAGVPPDADAFRRRAVSTAYYAVFDALATDCENRLAGAVGPADRGWAQSYRALEHGFAKQACIQAANLGFTAPLLAFAAAFANLQEQRHDADHNPATPPSLQDAQDAITLAEAAIASLHAAAPAERRAFALHLLLKRR